MIWKLVKAAVVASGPEHMIRCSDWHTANLAITTAAPLDTPQVKLIDWGNHHEALDMCSRARMENAITAFLQYLPIT